MLELRLAFLCGSRTNSHLSKHDCGSRSFRELGGASRLIPRSHEAKPELGTIERLEGSKNLQTALDLGRAIGSIFDSNLISITYMLG
jgi:hypothetical protein